jgi:hypothetical protein
MRGRRFVQGGRATLRAVLYMAALVATKRAAAIRTFYQCLVAAGKPKKFALVACMRKSLTILNTMVRTHERLECGRSKRNSHDRLTLKTVTNDSRISCGPRPVRPRPQLQRLDHGPCRRGPAGSCAC